jgi:outer membrane lipoprotein SlyB
LAGKGVADKETGSYASNIRPKNIEEAIDKMRGINITIRLYLGMTPQW